MTRSAKTDMPLAEPAVVLAATVSLPALLKKGERPDSAFRQLLYDVAVAASHLESARQYLADQLGVTSPQYNIVMVIGQSGNVAGLSVGEVASKLGVTGAFVTTEVNKLVKAGLIIKKSNPADGRGVLLNLSKDGYERVHGLEPELLMVNNRLFEKLTREDFLNLSRIMSLLVKNFSPTVALLKAMPAKSLDAPVHHQMPKKPRSKAKTD